MKHISNDKMEFIKVKRLVFFLNEKIFEHIFQRKISNKQ